MNWNLPLKPNLSRLIPHVVEWKWCGQAACASGNRRGPRKISGFATAFSRQRAALVSVVRAADLLNEKLVRRSSENSNGLRLRIVESWPLNAEH